MWSGAGAGPSHKTDQKQPKSAKNGVPAVTAEVAEAFRAGNVHDDCHYNRAGAASWINAVQPALHGDKPMPCLRAGRRQRRDLREIHPLLWSTSGKRNEREAIVRNRADPIFRSEGATRCPRGSIVAHILKAH